MTEVLKWVTAGLAIWGAVSILIAIFWVLVVRRIFRPRPVQPSRLSETFVSDKSVDTVNDVILEMRRRARRNGGL